jgi:hypothetical protein
MGAFVGYRAGAWGPSHAADANPTPATAAVPVEAPASPAPATEPPVAWVVQSPDAPLSQYQFMVGSKSAAILTPQQLQSMQTQAPYLFSSGSTVPLNPPAPPVIPPAKP